MSSAFVISLNIAKFISLFGGTALPGFIGLRLYPNLINQIIKKNNLRSIVVTGTNGKTTTARLIGSLLTQAGISYCHNRSGSNLIQGIATALINQSDWLGNLDQPFAVWEVDEATVPKVIPALKPEILLITNISRDQLDRYGEINTLLNLWQQSFADLPPTAKIFVNAADPRLKSLSDPRLGSFGQTTPGQGLEYPTEFKGKFNQDSLWAAEAIARQLKLSSTLVAPAAKTATPAFGRGEVFKIKNENYQINLVKNPASFKAVWQMFLKRRHLNQPLLLLLNDLTADGTDVSWIWDVSFTNLSKRQTPIVVSGIRAPDLALRLKYAGLKPSLIRTEPKINLGFEKLKRLQGSPKYVFCTYTAMLELRRYLKRTPWN
jgi:UDP-N-acetylmuramyl tripeptide synthase